MRILPQSLLNVLGLEVRIRLNDLVGAHPICNQIHDERYSDTHTSDAGPTVHDLAIERYSIQVHSDLHFADVLCDLTLNPYCTN